MRAGDAHLKDELSLTLEHDLDPASEEALQTVSVGTSILKSVFTLCNTTVGAGTLALPFFFSQTGLALGSGMLIAIAGFSCYSLHLLAACGRCEIALKQTEDGRPARSYLDVAYFAFKRSGRLVVTISMLLLTFGALVAYFVIIGSLLESAIVTFIEKGKGIIVETPSPVPVNAHWEAKVVADAVGIPSWLIEAPFLSLIALICPILPLGALKNMSALGFVSLVALCSVAFLIALVVQVRRRCLRAASVVCALSALSARSARTARVASPAAHWRDATARLLCRIARTATAASLRFHGLTHICPRRMAPGPRTRGRPPSLTSTRSERKSSLRSRRSLWRSQTSRIYTKLRTSCTTRQSGACSESSPLPPSTTAQPRPTLSSSALPKLAWCADADSPLCALSSLCPPPLSLPPPPPCRRVAAVINIATVATTVLYLLVGIFGCVRRGRRQRTLHFERGRRSAATMCPSRAPLALTAYPSPPLSLSLAGTFTSAARPQRTFC